MDWFSAARHRWRSLLLAVFAILFAFVPTFLFSLESRADDVSDFSFYERVSSIVGEVNEILAPSTEDDSDSDLKDGRTGNVGVYLGYSDENKNEKGIVGWIMTQVSNSSSSISYKNLEDVPTDNSSTNALLCYAGYGWLLQELGVDATANDGNIMSQLTRIVFGALLFIGYALSGVVPFIFRGALVVMKALNPFRLFGDVVEVGANAYSGVFGDLCTYISNMYKAIQNFSLLVLIPMFLVGLIAGMLLFSNAPGDRVKKVFRYFFRIFFIVAGIPMIGSTYTGILDAMSDNSGNYGIVNTAGDQIVYSTLVDFESWARNTRLDPPSNTLSVKWQKDHFVIGNNCVQGSQLALAINRKALGVSVADVDTDSLSRIDASQQTGTDVSVGSSTVWSVLGRYMSGAKYSSSSFESEQKTSITNGIAGGGFSSEDVVDWFDSKETNLKDDTLDLSGSGTIFNNGAIRGGGGSIANIGAPFVYSGSGSSSGGGDVGTKIGLSTMSMYNYLNTSFGDSEMTMYSPKKASSGYVRDSHMSVNHIGGEGPVGFLAMVQSIIELFVIGIVGIVYGFGVMFSNIKRGYRIIFDAPLALMGSFQAIGKILTYACVLVIEIMGTLLMYDVMTNLIIALVDLISAVFIGGGILSIALLATPMGMTVMKLLTIAILVYICAQAMKLRKVFIHGVDEMCANVISKFVVHMDKSGATVPNTFDMDRKTEDAIQGAAGISSRAKGQGEMSKGQRVARGLNAIGNVMMARDMLSAVRGADGSGAANGDGSGNGGGSAASDRDNMSRANQILDEGGIVGESQGAKAMDGSGLRDSMGRNAGGNGDSKNASSARDAMGAGAAAGAGSMARSAATAATAANPASATAMATQAGAAVASEAIKSLQSGGQSGGQMGNRTGGEGSQPVTDQSLSSGGVSDAPASGSVGDQGGVNAAMQDEPDGTRAGVGAGDVVTDRSENAAKGIMSDTSLPPAYGFASFGAGESAGESASGVVPNDGGQSGDRNPGGASSDGSNMANNMAKGVSTGGGSAPVGFAGNTASSSTTSSSSTVSSERSQSKESVRSTEHGGADGSAKKGQGSESAGGSAVKGVSGSVSAVGGSADALKKVQGTTAKTKGAATGMSGSMSRGASDGGALGRVKSIVGSAANPTGSASATAAAAAKKAAAVAPGGATPKGANGRGGAMQGGANAHYNAANIQHSAPFGQNGTKAGAARGANVKGPSAGASTNASGAMNRTGLVRGYNSLPAAASSGSASGRRTASGANSLHPDALNAAVGNYRERQQVEQLRRKAGTLHAAGGAAMLAAGLYSGNTYMTMKGARGVTDGTLTRTINGGTSAMEQKMAGALSNAMGKVVQSGSMQAKGQALYRNGVQQQQSGQPQRQQRSVSHPGNTGNGVFGGRNASGRRPGQGGYGG